MRLEPQRRGTKAQQTIFDRKNRFLWARLLRQQIIINVAKHSRNNTKRILLSLITDNKKSFTIDLTALTEVELQAFRECLLVAIEIAEPIVKVLDTAAQENAHADDSDDRLYRPFPTVVIRKGPLEEYADSVLQRRDASLRELRAQFFAGIGATEDGGDLDQHEQEDLGTEDNAQENGES